LIFSAKLQLDVNIKNKVKQEHMQTKKEIFSLKPQKISLIICLSFSMCIGGCAHLYKQNPQDPFEKYNRSAYNLNSKIETFILKPITTVYTHLIPWFVRDGIGNFFNNIDTLPDIANDLFQGNFKMASRDTSRFLLNSSFGIGGLFDVASRGGLPGHYQGFSKTLYVWGWKDSAYFILPALGPSTIRGTVSLVPSHYMDPLTYVRPTWLKYTLDGVKFTQIASVALPAKDKITQIAIDPYIAERNAYMQNLKFRLDSSKSSKKNQNDPVESESSVIQ
jgi:phospholipid-binding lipoprotein MlaA